MGLGALSLLILFVILVTSSYFLSKEYSYSVKIGDSEIRIIGYLHLLINVEMPLLFKLYYGTSSARVVFALCNSAIVKECF